MAPGENNKATMDLESNQNEDSVFTANEELSLATKSEPQAEIDEYADEVIFMNESCILTLHPLYNNVNEC